LPDGDISLGVGIDDNATSTAITIDASERVGFSTTSPQALTHIYANNSTAYDATATDGQRGTGATLFIENDANSNLSYSQIALQARTGYEYCRIVATGGAAPDLAFVVNNAERMRIDSAGRVTMPYQPAFKVHQNASGSLGVGNFTGTFSDTETGSFDNGNNFANNVFTAPVSGYYQFSVSVRCDGMSNYFRIFIDKNNAISSSTSLHAIYGNNISTNAENLQMSGVLHLAANDTARVIVSSQSDTSWIYQGEGFFSGFLIG